MKKNTKDLLKMGIVVPALVLSLAACGTSGTTSTPAPEAGEAATEETVVTTEEAAAAETAERLEREQADMQITPTQAANMLGVDRSTLWRWREAGKIVPKAEFNLLVSPWVGIEPMERMEKRLGIPFLHWPNLPVGAFETSKFLRALGEYAGVPSDKVESVIADQEGYYYYLIERYADLFLETRVMAKQFTVSADAQYSLALTKFLVNDLSLNPATQFVVDDTPKKYRESVAAEFSNLNHGIKAPVEFETDSWKISQAIRAHDYHGYPLVLGSYWEKEVTEEMYGHYLNISWPVQDKVVMDESYVGYQGGIKVIEDIYSVAVQRWN